MEVTEKIVTPYKYARKTLWTVGNGQSTEDVV